MNRALEARKVIPLDLQDLLAELRRRRWTLIRWGRESSPELLAAMYSWGSCSDVLILRTEAYATAYRAPSAKETFNPSGVVWQYHSSPLWTLRAVLSLSHPSSVNAPIKIEIPAAECTIPDGLPKPVQIRPL